MSVEQTQRTIDRYFEVMADGGDFSEFFADDVTWAMIDAGHVVHGRPAVRDFVVALHTQMSDVHTRSISVMDGAAYLEGDCINPDPGAATPRIGYCVAYDFHNLRIQSMRCYGQFHTMLSRVLEIPPANAAGIREH